MPGQGRQPGEDDVRAGRVHARLARLLRILRDASGAALPHTLGSVTASVCFVAAVENTTPSPGGTDRPQGLSTAGGQYCRQWSRILAYCPIQSPLRRAEQCLLPIAWSPLIGQGALAIAARTAVYGPVCTVVWEGRSREAPPYPDQHLFRDIRQLLSAVLGGLPQTAPENPSSFSQLPPQVLPID